jgi:ABC-type transport system substrate-binding protein
LVGSIACRESRHSVEPASPDSFTIGYGLATGQNPQAGVRQAVRNIALEGLVAFGRDARAQPWLAESWEPSRDGLLWKVRLRKGLTFHNGAPVTAAVVRDIVRRQLPEQIGPAFEDVEDIVAVSDDELDFHVRQPSPFVIEGLDLSIQAPEGLLVGTGAFQVQQQLPDRTVLVANPRYQQGPPVLRQLNVKAYASVRSAWADMLRGQLDMLYEVGVDALDSLERSSFVRVFTFQRSYAYVVILNVRRPALRDKQLRQQLNSAIDREEIVKSVLGGHGRPATGPVVPSHWAYDSSTAAFQYKPTRIHDANSPPLRLVCLIGDASMERLALDLQRQLSEVGVDLQLELTTVDKVYERIQSGDFDAVLADAVNGPTLVRPYLFWHTGSPYNWGQFSSPAVDAALDRIRHSANDDDYKAGVAAFQRAIFDDPPAIFLAWSERARAVSTRFDVPVEPGRDILSTLRLWRPAADKQAASPN